MNRSKRAYWFLGVALLALLAVCVYVFVLSNGGDDRGNAQDSTELDETGQSPRISSPVKQTETGASENSEAPEKADAEGEASESVEAETSVSESASGDPDAEAREYDKNGQVGDPPSGWKDDYAHWDSDYWGVDLAIVGIPQVAEDEPVLIYKPTEEQEQRMEELDQEIDKAAENGQLSEEQKDGFVRVEFEENDFVYAAPSFVNRLNEITAEQTAINEASMAPVYGNIYDTAMSRGENHDLFKIVYFRKPDGTLIREVTLPGGEPMEFVAGPPPDFSQFTESEVESMKNKWASFWMEHTARR